MESVCGMGSRMAKINRRSVGAQREQQAAEYLKAKGYEILAQNIYTPFGELDILAGQGDMLIFTEIKYRSGTQCGDPLEAVDRRKQRRICQSAMYYYAQHGYGKPCRFDVIAIYGDGRVVHIENAFEYQF